MDHLDDIYIPPESFLLNLLQPGWIVLALLLVGGLLAAYWLIKTAARRKLRKQFISYLENQSQLDASQINALLKAYIGALQQTVQANSLHGKKWRAFLLANCNMQGYMKQLDYLASGHYEKDEDKQAMIKLNELAIYWIKRHKRILA